LSRIILTKKIKYVIIKTVIRLTEAESTAWSMIYFSRPSGQ